ncbi:MAG: tRNA preQ1(34) S-adenosylmethionine ribosyltransferase-isomerase QueA [Fimbriimonadaceae bacterium]|jgi:S-adenosylmethionine:tRNA ribosyltransferase-isomerase|nr:tRNA preQ1(34) S-adenosylmethionine ribosyltransferase-isomerase QueA [Fimbriimonadaceae bacterium]
MRVEDLDYFLPPELIAQEPLADRTASRLLHLDRKWGHVHHRQFRDCLSLLEAGDLLVMNNTRVTALRLLGHRPTGGQVEALLLKEVKDGSFIALTKPAKKLAPGSKILFGEDLMAEVREDLGEGQKLIQFDTQSDWRKKVDVIGLAPLPPYIRHTLSDRERYNTVYASVPGSAAAPTAGLHFTPEILDQLQEKGVKLAHVSLDVSIDTFRPVQSESVEDHVMHGEVCRVPEETVRAVSECQGRIIAVGTTSVRTLESFATGPRQIRSGEMVSRLFIVPSYKYQVVDGMFTNFHMPRTTMLLMLAALVGPDSLFEAYRQAVESRYRFLSFGDSMLIL